ncbi:MAG: type II secretion system protein [Candidatus Omnitrophota bacterium]
MKTKGFSLVEIMVSIVILALLASGIFSVIVSGRYLVGRSRKRFQAIEVARAEVERLKPFVRGDTNSSLVANSAWSAWNHTLYPPFGVRYKVDPAPGSYQYRKVTVQVNWSDVSI